MGRHISRKNEGQLWQEVAERLDRRFAEPDRRRPIPQSVPKHWALAEV